MPATPKGWLFHGDAQPILDKAITQCARDHGGKLTGNPSTYRRMGKREDGSRFPITIVLVEEDADDWWQEYARVHGWLDVSREGVDRLYGREIVEPK